MKWLPIYSKQYGILHENFERAISAQGYANDSEYVNHVKEFLFFLESKDMLDIKQVKTREIIEYYEYLRERPNQRREGFISDSAIRMQMYAVRLFFDYLLEIKRIQSSPAHLPKFLYNAIKIRDILSREHIDLLYKHASNPIEKAILGLGYGCALRRKEMELLDCVDIVFSQGVLNVRKGKGNKSGTVPMTDRIIKDFKEYIAYERAQRINTDMPACPAFFLNKWGLRIDGQSLNYKLKKLMERAGLPEAIIKKSSLHTLRHSIATHMLDNGADIDFVRKFLRHVMLDTTNLYSRRRKQQIKNTINP